MPVESLSKKKIRVAKIVAVLKKEYPNSKCSLNFKNVHQLMVATILSAQCTDERVNKVTPALFRKHRSVKAFANANINELQDLVFTTGFYVNKAKSIKRSAEQLIENHNGDIPDSLDLLVKLAGVGRKTASVILGVGFKIAEGIVVDTHVGRINRLLKLTKEKDAVKIERDLIKIIDQPDWIVYSHMMIDHGRAVCIARRPQCTDCVLSDLCPSQRLFADR